MPGRWIKLLGITKRNQNNSYICPVMKKIVKIDLEDWCIWAEESDFTSAMREVAEKWANEEDS